MRRAGPTSRRGAWRREPGAGDAWRAGCGQDGAAGLPGRAGVGLPGGARRRCRGGDGVRVRRGASVVRADAGSPGAAPSSPGAALRTAFGLGPGSAPDRFLVALAVLSLLADAAEEQPLLCLVDDQQWLDQASAQVLGFVARRLAAESIGLVFAAHVPGDELAELPELAVEGLREADARAAGRDGDRPDGRAGPRPDRRRGARQPAGAVGAAAELDAGGAGRRVRPPRRDAALGADRGELPAAAGRASGRHPRAVAGRGGRAGRRSGAGMASGRAARIRPQAATPGAAAGLLEFGTRVRFRHPLVRSAAYRSASLQERQDIHRALAQVTDPKIDPDRRAWHRAQAAPGPDEDVAAELERSAGRAQARGAWPRRPRSWSARRC